MCEEVGSFGIIVEYFHFFRSKQDHNAAQEHAQNLCNVLADLGKFRAEQQSVTHITSTRSLANAKTHHEIFTHQKICFFSCNFIHLRSKPAPPQAVFGLPGDFEEVICKKNTSGEETPLNKNTAKPQ